MKDHAEGMVENEGGREPRGDAAELAAGLGEEGWGDLPLTLEAGWV